MSEVLVLIPTFNHPEFTDKLLSSLEKCDLSWARIEIHDDGSDEQWMPTGRAFVPVRRWTENVGYVNHINRVVAEHWKPDVHLLLLNYDTDFSKTPKDWLPRLVTALEARKEWDHAGAVGPLLTYGPRPQVVCMRDGEFVLSEPHVPGQACYPTTALSGACVLYHKDFVKDRLDRCGWFLDPNFNRVSCDDWDLGFWGRSQGWTFWVNSELAVIHDDRESDRAGSEKGGARHLMEKWGNSAAHRQTMMHYIWEPKA